MSIKNESKESFGTEFAQKLHTLNKLLCTYTGNSFELEFWEVQNHIQVLWEMATLPAEKYQCIETAALFPELTLRKELLNFLGFQAYESSEFNYAAHAFMRVAQSGDIGGKNNFAYMLRKGLCESYSFYSPLDILRILQPGLKVKDSLSVVNTALVLALLLGTDSDWTLADNLISCLSDTNSVESWWGTIGKNGDAEGYLVHLWLLRHKLIANSSLGTLNDINDRVFQVFSCAPAWLSSVAK